MPFGYYEDQWSLAKDQAKAAIAARSRVRGMVPYSELVSEIESIRFALHEARFFALLGEISEEEDRAGRGMMTALVVHKEGDMQPGPGFFELARKMGRDVSDLLTCWVEEFKKVHSSWAGGP